MESLTQFLTTIIPAVLVLFAMYLAIKAYLDKDLKHKMLQLKAENKELVLPTRLQAYERVTLFLERISPANLILRVNQPDFTSGYLHQQLLSEIREEFNHNLSQQVYMGNEVWEAVKQAKDAVTIVINESAQQVGPDQRGVDLARVVFDKMSQLELDPIVASIMILKEEIRQLY